MERTLQRKSQPTEAEEELFLSSSSLLGEDRRTVLMSERRENGDAEGEKRELLKEKVRGGGRLTEREAGGCRV